MKQIIQDLISGETILEEVPVPKLRLGHVLIKTHRSLVSLGTERMLVEFSKANFLDKARQQPEKVKQVFTKIKSDGLRPTLDAVFRKLGEPLPLGYCNAGEIVAIGKDVQGFKIGDRVISNGNHAELVCVPQNLVAIIPEAVSYEEASFTVIGAIALQGIRLIKPSFGETIVVTGLGLIGLMATQLLKANGCQVIGLDYDQSKVEMAKQWGVKAFNVSGENHPVKIVENRTKGIGADGVLITASTKSNEVISQAAQMSRKRGRIVLVGVIGLNIRRSDFYEKELSFQVSCSYGPGRYDDDYENKGLDYPLPFVRWTEKRNFEAVLSSIAEGGLKVRSLITDIIDLENYNSIYKKIGSSKSIATILQYPGDVSIKDTNLKIVDKNFSKTKGVLGIIGAGNFTKAMVAPILKKLNANVKYIASSGGLSATSTAKKYKFGNATTNYLDILSDPEVDAVLITTRHNLHATQVIEALNAGKHVFVEKPLALTLDEINQIQEVYNKNNQTLTVGFNRRFSPFIQDAKIQLGGSDAPINVVATMNAGFIPANHWVQDMKLGGGRIIGEACHYIDLISFLTGSHVEKIVMNSMGTTLMDNTDNASILLKYKNGSQGVINYYANGSKAYAKERVEIYAREKTIIVDNFRRSKYYGFKKSGLKSRQDKGHHEQFKRFIKNLQNGGAAIIPFNEIINTSKAAIGAIESLKKGTWINVE